MGQWDNGGGFSVDTSVRIEADDRAGLERLLRYCARPPFALERLEAIDAHRLIYRLPKPRPEWLAAGQEFLRVSAAARLRTSDACFGFGLSVFTLA